MALKLHNIMTGIQSWFTGNAPLVAAAPGGLWRSKAPEGTAQPYVTYGFPEIEQLKTFDADFEDCIFRFTFYHESEDTAPIDDAVEKFAARFDDEIVTITSYTTIHLTRVGAGEAMLGDVRTIFLDYQLLVKHTPA